MMKRNIKGFTITELVIVIAVIAILAAVLIPTFSGVISKAQDSAAIQEARNMYTQYVTGHDYTAGAPARNLVIKVADDKYVAVVGGEVYTAVYASKAEAVSANIGITDADIVYEGTDVSVPEGGSTTPSTESSEPTQGNEPTPPVQPTTYNVTKTATNATITGADTATEGEAYTATIAISEHYNTLTVTMGGTDITATAYSNGTVTIPAVTGNIEITAVAAANLANPNDANWKADTRLSGSQKVEGSAPGYTLTNYFALQNGDTVYVKNYNMNFAGTYCSAYYKGTGGTADCLATFVLPYGAETLHALSGLDFGATWTQFTVTYDGVAYMRLCGQLAATASDVEIHIMRNGEWVTAS